MENLKAMMLLVMIRAYMQAKYYGSSWKSDVDYFIANLVPKYTNFYIWKYITDNYLSFGDGNKVRKTQE